MSRKEGIITVYDVAIWKWFDGKDFPYVDQVASPSPLLVILALMRQHGLRRVRYAAAMLPDGIEVRWEKGLVVQPLRAFQCSRCGVQVAAGSLEVMCGDAGWCLGCVPVYANWRVPVAVCVPAGFRGSRDR